MRNAYKILIGKLKARKNLGYGWEDDIAMELRKMGVAMGSLSDWQQGTMGDHYAQYEEALGAS